MARYQFTAGRQFPARLYAIHQRPLENQRLMMLRLEFELFSEVPGRALESTGKIACRDLVVGTGVDPSADRALKPLVVALGIQRPEHPNSWLNIEPHTRWVVIEFGPVADAVDQRNPFRTIRPFDSREYQVKEYAYDLHKEWVKPQEAAAKLKCSASTVRRMVAKHEPEHGSNLVRLTKGGHRLINIKLLRNLV